MQASRLAVVGLAAFALAAAGCGDDDDENAAGGTTDQAATGTETAPAGGAQTTVRLSATEFAFDPANPSVDEPGIVTFEVENDGQTVHALEVEGPKGEAETEEIAAGESAALEVDLSEPGSYEMYCPVGNHRDQGMEGTVTVGGGGGGAAEDSDGEDDSGSGGAGTY
jgi:plastocyanin